MATMSSLVRFELQILEIRNSDTKIATMFSFNDSDKKCKHHDSLLLFVRKKQSCEISYECRRSILEFDDGALKNIHALFHVQESKFIGKMKRSCLQYEWSMNGSEAREICRI